MKKAILGVGMLLSGIVGIGFIFLCTVLNGDGVGSASVFECIFFMGLMVPFLFCLSLAIVGLVIAYSETFNRKL